MTRRPVLAPGLPILRRSSTELQIGLSPGHRLPVADTPAVRRTLSSLCRGEAPRTDPQTRAVLATLAPVLRDGDTLTHPEIPAAEVAAVTLLHPDDAAARLAARRRTEVVVRGDVGIDVRHLLQASGLSSTDDVGGTRPVVLLLCLGDLDRSASDRLLRQRTPYLPVRVIEAEVLVGPFVAPGRSACLRCIDIHRSVDLPGDAPWPPTEFDPTRRDGVAVPVDAATTTMALGYAVADLVRYAEGDRPRTWSATTTFSGTRTEIEPVGWLQHPRCGCSWIAGTAEERVLQAGSVTMGA